MLSRTYVNHKQRLGRLWSLWLEESQNSEDSEEDVVDSLICHKD